MPPDSWKRIRDVFEAALLQPVEQRASFVAQACRDDPAVHEQVAALLASHRRADGFLETPAGILLGTIPAETAADARATRMSDG
jgi:hypothetical protein